MSNLRKVLQWLLCCINHLLSVQLGAFCCIKLHKHTCPWSVNLCTEMLGMKVTLRPVSTGFVSHLVRMSLHPQFPAVVAGGFEEAGWPLWHWCALLLSLHQDSSALQRLSLPHQRPVPGPPPGHPPAPSHPQLPQSHRPGAVHRHGKMRFMIDWLIMFIHKVLTLM